MSFDDRAAMERLDAQIARIQRIDGSLGAFALTTPEMARETAWTVARAGLSGPLSGRTLAVKDVFDLRGLPTGGGARTPVRAEAEADSTAVARLRAAGMVPLGKTATVELAFGTWGINRATGTPRNPWDTRTVRVPGGSSSGSAVAVAAGLADTALGTDTGGSIRIPCALNGITGLKPSAGRVSRAGVLPLSPTLDTVGPMAWSVADVATMMEALAGPDPRDPAMGDALPFDAAAALAGMSLRGTTVAILPDSALAGVDDPVGDAYLRAVSDLERLGARLREARPPVPPEACVEPTGAVIAAEAWRLWKDRLERFGGEMDPGVRARLEAGSAQDPASLGRLLAARSADQARFHAWFQDMDVLVTPTVPLAAPPLETADEAALPFSRFTRMANWLDLPALALPCGQTASGLPLSIQLLALPRREDRVVALGHAYQGTTDWHRRRPTVGGASPEGTA